MQEVTLTQEPAAVPSTLTVRVGSEMVYEPRQRTHLLLLLKMRGGEGVNIREERLEIDAALSPSEFVDSHGNIVTRVTLAPGPNRIRHDALVEVSSAREDYYPVAAQIPPEELPPSVLPYTLPSRYCDSDKLLDFAWEHFGQCEPGLPTVRAISDWVHENVEYRTFSGSPLLSAADVLDRGYGVCRDFAHIPIALCRTFNIPARYQTSHLPDIGCQDPGSPMDFHACFEVYLGHRWYTFDARFNTPRIGRIRIASGLDAVDTAFTTIYGSANLAYFNVWAYQVDPREAAVGDPVDTSKRIDGTPEIRFSR